MEEREEAGTEPEDVQLPDDAVEDLDPDADETAEVRGGSVNLPYSKYDPPPGG